MSVRVSARTVPWPTLEIGVLYFLILNYGRIKKDAIKKYRYWHPAGAVTETEETAEKTEMRGPMAQGAWHGMIPRPQGRGLRPLWPLRLDLAIR